jgi:signal transduction histidine kinase/ActR/RegA family two-component response regulator
LILNVNDLATRAIEDRALVLAPTERDGELCRNILGEAGVICRLCSTLVEICQEIEVGAGTVILTEEFLSPEQMGHLAAVLSNQPPWSDLPMLVLTREGANSEIALQTLEALGNVTLLERPVRVPALVSAVRAALRARRRQYQNREHLGEIIRTAEALRDADQQKDAFLAMLAHELRNPLAPVRNALHILELIRDDPVQMERLRAMMERQVTHLSRLVDDLLDVSRIMRGRIELRREVTDLATVINRAIETAEPIINTQGHRLTVSLPRESVRLDGDMVRLAQVFSNLLNNAAKYTNRSGRIWLVAGLEDGEVVVRVRDNGIGIPAELLPRVFDLFVQADGSMARSQGGLGIGLTLVRQLVEMHGGRVEAHSDGPGKGSEFVVRLPVLKSSPPPDLPPPSTGGRVTRPLRVLVVDDNVDAVESMAMLLSLKGHDVRTATTAAEALTIAREFQPEVGLLDVGLPGTDGYELTGLLRKEPRLSSTYLIAVTGYGQEEDCRRAINAGFDAHLTKPVDPVKLSRLLIEKVQPSPAADRQPLPD